MIFFGFPLFALLSITCLALSYSNRFPVLRANRLFWWNISIGFLVTYLICLAGVFTNPYWLDNGVEEQIHFPDHFGWALFTSTILQFVIVPASFVMFKLIEKLKSRTSASSQRATARG